MTSGIRAVRHEDLAAVAELYEQVWRSGHRRPPPGLAGYFSRTLLDHPWADPELPSLVHEAPDGEIVGFLGSSPRRLRLDDRPLRLACSSHLVVHPDWRARGVGALLTRRFLAGPQDLSITDGANEASRALWLGLGGQARVHASVGWFRVFRPGSVVDASLALLGQDGWRRRVAGALAGPVDALARAAPGAGPRLRPPEPEGSAETLTVPALLEQMSDAGRWWRLRPDYDAEYLAWLFAELDAVSVRGRPVRHLVRDHRGRVRGWYLCFLPENGIAQVLQVGVPGPDPGPVLDHLAWYAHEQGAAALHGRMEPVTAGLLGARGTLLRTTSWALVHSTDPEILALLGGPRSLLSRLDGEWWMGHGVLWR